MKVLDNLREFAYLRRIAIAAERQATALETLATIATDTWAKGKIRPRGNVSEFDLFDVDAANEKWAKQQEMAEMGIESEEP